MASPRVWFITGTSSGFGKVMTELALNHGDVVVATLRKPGDLDNLRSEYPSDKLAILKLDVSKRDEIVAAFEKARQLFGKIDIVFNNAGYGLIGEVEGTDEEVARRNFDTNFWGSANVTREALRFFREVNPPGYGGRLLVTSSECGIQGYPGYGYYCASKHAVEGLHDSLAKEIDPEWNIKLTLVEPGYFQTSSMTKVTANGAKLPPHPAYTKPTLPSAVMRAWSDSAQVGVGSDPVKGMKKVFELAAMPDPPLRFPIGADVIEVFSARSKALAETVEKFGSYSNNLELDK
ncbi:unnamed protein product [Somion occarium]|uniref:NAD(P)-binding protein n=1 Tax=Somion occarium TaxID=3059160 RepID=A0ABP1CTI4_9APHY